MSQTLHLNESQFTEEVLQSGVPVLVDFWAEWCQPCRALGPTIDELAAESSGRFKVAKVDIDRNPQLAQTYGIRSIPTMLIFEGGRPVDQISGLVPKQQILEAVERRLQSA